jgi:F-box and WD-40 domain protein CDC4
VSLHHLAGHTHSVRCIEIAGHYCVSGSYDCTARVSKPTRPFHSDTKFAKLILPFGLTQLWNLETGECLQVLRGHYHQIYDIAFDGEKVATGSLDSTVRIWSAATG